MEDGMEEIHDLVLAETKSLDGEAFEAKESGLDKNLIVNVAPGNYGGEEGKPDEKNGGLTEDVRKEENQKEGGIINHLISNLVSPRNSPTVKEADERKAGADLEVKSEDHGTFKSEEEFEGGGGGGGGGIINNLISNMFHHHQDQGGRGEERGEKEQKAEAGGSRSGLVDELISNLSTPLAENAAPATDEASMLIHSIVHD